MIQQRSTFEGLQYVQLLATLPLRNITYFLLNGIKKKNITLIYNLRYT